MYLVKGLLIILWFIAVPFAMGSLPVFQTGKKENSWLSRLVCGYALMFAFFEVLALPMIFAGLSFAVLKYIYSAVCIVLSIMALLKIRKNFLQEGKEKIKSIREIPWIMWAAFLLIALQMGAYVLGMATDLDDSFYVATAATTLETGGMFQYGAYTGRLAAELPSRYVLAPFPIMLAFFSDAVQMHPAVVAHTIQPVFFLLISYSVYGFIGKKLMGEDKKAVGFFMFFLALVQTFSYYSVYSQGTFMLIRIWQGKALLAAFVLPAIFYRSFCCMQEDAARGDWLRLLCLMLAACLVSSMGMMLAPVTLGIMAILYGVLKKQWRKVLYMFLCCLPNLCCAVIYLLIR